MITENGQLVINLASPLLTSVILVAYALWGWSRGFRWVVTIAGAVTLGYLLAVPNGGVILNLVNGIYAFGLRFMNFLSPALANLFPPAPVIPVNAEAPVLLRFLTFVIFYAIGVGWKGPWEGPKPLVGFSGSQQLRLLGALTGIYIGVLTISAIAIFWQLSTITLLPSWLDAVLASLPTYESVVTVFIVSFFALLAIVIFLQFLRSLQSPAPKK